jgi:hypothetical protein
MSAKLVPTSADRGCDAISLTDTYGRILGFLDRITSYIYLKYISGGARGSIVFKALCYKPEGHGFETR